MTLRFIKYSLFIDRNVHENALLQNTKLKGGKVDNRSSVLLTTVH